MHKLAAPQFGRKALTPVLAAATAVALLLTGCGSATATSADSATAAKTSSKAPSKPAAEVKSVTSAAQFKALTPGTSTVVMLAPTVTGRDIALKAGLTDKDIDDALATFQEFYGRAFIDMAKVPDKYKPHMLDDVAYPDVAAYYDKSKGRGTVWLDQTDRALQRDVRVSTYQIKILGVDRSNVEPGYAGRPQLRLQVTSQLRYWVPAGQNGLWHLKPQEALAKLGSKYQRYQITFSGEFWMMRRATDNKMVLTYWTTVPSTSKVL